MTRACLVAVLATLAAACSPEPAVIRGIPEGSALRIFFDLAGAFDVPQSDVYRTRDGLLAVTDLPPEAHRPPLLSVEARGFDGCLLANGTVHGLRLTLRPVERCGAAEPEPPRPVAQPPAPPSPPPQTDTDGDGFLDSLDECPLQDGRARYLCSVEAGIVPGEDQGAALIKCSRAGGAPLGWALPSPTRPGCLDGDRDADGYPDSVDDCPDVARGPYPGPGAGCPDTRCPTPAPVLLRWQPAQTFPPGTDTSGPKIVDATPTELPAGERRTVVVRVVGVDARTLSRVDNPTVLIIEKIGGLTSAHAFLQIKVPADAPVGPLGQLSLFFGPTKLMLAGLEVARALVSCE